MFKRIAPLAIVLALTSALEVQVQGRRNSMRNRLERVPELNRLEHGPGLHDSVKVDSVKAPRVSLKEVDVKRTDVTEKADNEK